MSDSTKRREIADADSSGRRRCLHHSSRPYALRWHTIFAAATGTTGKRVDAGILGAVAAEAMAQAVNRAVLSATGIPGYPAHRDLLR